MRIVVRAVEARRENVQLIISQLPREAEVLYDKGVGAMETFFMALKSAGTDSMLMLEDDAVLCPGFWVKAMAEIYDKPRDVVQFYSMGSMDLQRGSHWSRRFSSNLCTYYPAMDPPRILRFAPGWMDQHPEHPTGYDLLVDGWLRSVKRPHWIVVPNLVDHLEGKSAINPKRSSKRRSTSFGRELHSAVAQ